jgi:PAS domain S-box-containing protein
MRVSESQHRLLFNSIDEGFRVLERIEATSDTPIDFRYIETNPAFEKHSGHGGVVGKTIRETSLGEPEDWYSIHDLVLTSGQPIRHQHALETRGKFLELYEFPLNNPEQNRLAIIFQDITERNLTSANGLKWTAIVDASDDMIASMNTEGLFTSWNPGAERMFGYMADEVLFKPTSMMLSPDQNSAGPGVFDSFEKGDATVHLEVERRRKNASMFWLSVTMSPLKDGDDKIIGASIIGRDITAQRKAEAHREILVGELNHRVKNTLAIVTAIASQTLAGASSIKSAKDAFEERFLALSRAHDLLMRENWSGTDLGNIISTTIEPFSVKQN